MTDKDLSDLVGRIAEGIANDASWPLDGKVRRDAADALDALVAEVERLRGEREKAVAYLRADAAIRDDAHGDRPPPCWPAVALRQMANDIERGDHHPEEDA
jgi:hypothetical protein